MKNFIKDTFFITGIVFSVSGLLVVSIDKTVPYLLFGIALELIAIYLKEGNQ